MKKYVYAFLIWVMIIPIAILNGGFREYVLAYLGGLVRPLIFKERPKGGLNKRATVGAPLFSTLLVFPN